MSAIQLNSLITVNNKYGIGKVIGINENECKVSFFLDIKKQIIETYDINELQLVFLSPQTRVYIKNENGKWKIGRIKDYDDAINPTMDYLVQFPNHKEEWFASEELEVRCLLPFNDPTEVLSTSGGESQFLNDSRKKVLEWLINLRASSRGLTALTSASIDLVVHQVNIARKVLTDPVQRYLLSDEVGMGKTIEAGIIARQCLLDSSTSKVLIIVPKHLITKWKREMFDRFYLDDFYDRVEITSPEHMNFQTGQAELTIIDEAHHIIGELDTYSQVVRENVIQMAEQSSKLLLLSATPGLGREDILLNLLKVLDPLIFKNETLESFKEKVAKQSEHGSFLRTLKVNQSSFLLKRSLSKVTNLFPNDTYAEDLTNQLLILLDEESKEKKIESIIKQLRSHLVETWRLHNRLIRTRRVDSEGWEFQDRGIKNGNEYNKDNIEIIIHPNHNLEAINDSIEEWRSYIALQSNEISKEEQKLLISKYINLLEASNADTGILKTFLEDYMESSTFDNEVRLLENITNCISEYNYDETIDEISIKIQLFLSKLGTSSIGVLFISDIHLAKKYQASLKNIFGNESVLLYYELNNSDSESKLNINAKTRILICDKSVEEGVDFQFADAIIHFDLPLNPSRIEQRIGRLDRYGRKKTLKIQHLVILPTDNTLYPWKAWFELLFNGFGVFNEPISDVQLKLEQITASLHKTLFQYGSIGLEDHFDENNNIDVILIEYIRSLIAAEREALDEQYALNHLSLYESDSLNIRDEIEESEYNEKELEDNINHWLFGVLQFKKWNIDDKVFEIKWNQNTLVPKQQFWSKNNLITTDMWEGEFENSLGRSLSYYRKESVENSQVSLLRPGHPLFSTLQHYMEWEDRGTAFSTFRVVDDKFPIFIPHGDIGIMFKLHFIVEASASSTDGEQEYNSDHYLYMRRTDDYLPPKIFTVYIDEKLNIIEDNDIKDTLDEPYIDNRKIDTNLSSRRHVIDHFIDPDKLDKLCENIRQNAHSILLNSIDFLTTHKEAIEKASTEIEQTCLNIQRRQKIQEALNQKIDLTEYKKTIKFEKSLLEGILNPSIKLDSFGMFFLSRYPISELKDIHE